MHNLSCTIGSIYHNTCLHSIHHHPSLHIFPPPGQTHQSPLWPQHRDAKFETQRDVYLPRSHPTRCHSMNRRYLKLRFCFYSCGALQLEPSFIHCNYVSSCYCVNLLLGFRGKSLLDLPTVYIVRGSVVCGCCTTRTSA